MSNNLSRVQEHRKRLSEENGKVVTIHMSQKAMTDINKIIQLMSTKGDKLTVRDVVCLSVGDIAARLTQCHDSTKAAHNQDEEQRKNNQKRWRRLQKGWSEILAQVRSHYHLLPRGRRPKDVKASGGE